MSGTTDPVSEPADNAEWARATDQRVTALENPSSARAGKWVMSTSPADALIASYVNGGSVVLARKPAGGENDPDQITDPVNPSLCVIRTATFSVPVSPGGYLRWDGTSSENGGDWTGGKSDFDSVFVPESGTYAVHATVHSVTGTGAIPFCIAITVNGQGRAAGSFSTCDGGGGSLQGSTSMANRVLELNAGDALGVWIVNTFNINYTVGLNSRAPGTPPSTLTAFMVTRKE